MRYLKEFYRRQGEAREQKRILAILQEFDWLTSDGKIVIALIKGKSK